MGHVLFPIRDFYDSASELVGIKSGILLNRFDISKILLEKYNDDFLKSDKLDSLVRLGSDVITNMIVQLRRKLGNLPMQSPTQKDYLVMREYLIKTGDMTISGLPSVGFHFIHENPGITKEELAEKIKNSEKIDLRLATAAANIALEMEDTDIVMKAPADWDGFTPLSDIFDTEIKPKDDLDFIEQKFIDYLAVNGHEIENIHWRNFERFCAEYFKRQGYVVVLGPGTNDGGIDIRVFKEKSSTSSPFILIQCKRYKGEHKVTIETVKAFYSDVLFEGANEGVIATTGHIASGGKKVCQARKYNITFTEKDNVSKWATNMWTHK